MSTKNNRQTALIFGCLSICLWMCTPKATAPVLSQEDTSIFYADFELESLVYHDSDDSSTIYLRMPASYLMNKKYNNTRDYKALHLKLMVVDSLQRLTDTLETTYQGFDVSDRQSIIMQERLAINKGTYKILVEISDLNKSNVSKEVVLVDKTNREGVQNFLLRNEQGEPLFGHRAAPGRSFTLETARNATSDSLELFEFKQDTKLPPPPFSSNAVETPDVKLAIRKMYALNGGRCVIQQEGLYQCIRLQGSGLSLIVRQQIHNYPMVDHAQQLHFPLRYITTKAEYDEMNKSAYAKPLVDKFWMESGGTRDRGRELIKKYYSRVEESNRYFTSYTEGWRTDRGMIYLVYGPPSLVEHQENQEIWHYSNGSDDGDIVFVFNRVKTPIGLIHYQLKRDPYYKAGWEMMVNSWRNGRVR